jgi:Xaa-Pro aminopeptidase
LTCIKDEAEIARIEINVAGNDRVFGAVQDAISPGMTEIDLWSVIYHAMCDIAGEPIISVRGVVERAGFGGHFPHHSGHAYGLFQQEHPFLIPAERILLQPGMIVTLEPGIYLPGWGGMRLEGNYVITAAGARRLDRFPSELIVC